MKKFSWKKLLPLLCCLCLALTLAACDDSPEPAEAPQVQAPQTAEPAVPQEVEPQQEVPTQGDDLTPPPEALVPFEPSQAELHEGDPLLVTDAFTYTYMYMDTDETGNMKTFEHPYAIPQVMMDSPEITALNQEIYQKLYNAELIETVENNNENRGTYAPHYLEVSYSWAIQGDILSLAIQAPSTDFLEGYVYNISISKEALLSNEEVLAASAMSWEDYLEQVRLALSNEFWNTFAQVQDYVTAGTPEDIAVYDDCLQRTMAQENLEAAIPYYDMEGKLWILGSFHFPAGGGQHNRVVCLDDLELSPLWAEKVTA